MMSKYALANSTVQWFQGRYPGAVIKPNVLVIHTTEGTSWDGYDGGAIAPNYTARPDMARRRLDWRQHFPDERSSRALVNQPGGVETNTLNAIQVELVGTCDPTHRHTWGNLRAGVHYIYWPDAPDWALEAVAAFVRDLHQRHGLRLTAPTFKAYPASYGTKNGVRMSFDQWRNFRGICGHQHVPENVHGDPGDIAIARILMLAAQKTVPSPKPTRVEQARALLSKAADVSGPIRKAKLKAALKLLPHK